MERPSGEKAPGLPPPSRTASPPLNGRTHAPWDFSLAPPSSKSTLSPSGEICAAVECPSQVRSEVGPSERRSTMLRPLMLAIRRCRSPSGDTSWRAKTPGIEWIAFGTPPGATRQRVVLKRFSRVAVNQISPVRPFQSRPAQRSKWPVSAPPPEPSVSTTRTSPALS
jgi:hypothetical protein